jgi:hypothetical protein
VLEGSSTVHLLSHACHNYYIFMLLYFEYLWFCYAVLVVYVVIHLITIVYRHKM